MIVDKLLLFPYFLVLVLRNYMYDKGILKSYKSPLPSICVGNVTAGGTGKTPMVELLIRLYKEEMRIAVVSRGYGRKTKGPRMVSVDDTYRDVGDEPLQIKRKFPDVMVMVDASRKRAVDALASLPDGERPDMVIFDDAYQHRRIRAGFNIVLVSSSRPVFRDALLPIGRLRDLPSRVAKADMVVVTKVEEAVDDALRRRWRHDLRLPSRIPLLMSRIAYLTPEPVFPGECDGRYKYATGAVLVTGIADNATLRREAGWRFSLNEVLSFPDHHGYSSSDFARIVSALRRYPTSLVLTTEKDAQRLVSHPDVPVQIKSRLFYLPIVSEIIPDVDVRRYIQEELPGVGLAQLKENITIS
ncbi:MAG TPA: tetraacyldisaccharide 4'-kinase [Candidatus Coprenecus pullistercoris]|nr:tetraacyldisaccharide 4'-kinase [Candidatus Coprenecus pullistercoris]